MTHTAHRAYTPGCKRHGEQRSFLVLAAPCQPRFLPSSASQAWQCGNDWALVEQARQRSQNVAAPAVRQTERLQLAKREPADDDVYYCSRVDPGVQGDSEVVYCSKARQASSWPSRIPVTLWFLQLTSEKTHTLLCIPELIQCLVVTRRGLASSCPAPLSCTRCGPGAYFRSWLNVATAPVCVNVCVCVCV